MPSRKKAEELDWSGFPPTPPELEDWKPDPDSIAKPGLLKDPRFNKDPYEEARSRAARKQGVYHGHQARSLSSASSVQGTTVKPLSDGKWPAQMPRGYFPQQSLPDSKQSMPVGGPVQFSANGTVESAPAMAENARVDTTMISPTESPTESSTESSTELSTKSPTKSHLHVAPNNDGLPAWAGPLKKALAEDAARNKRENRQAFKKSLPPHLRGKQPTVTNGHKDVSEQQSRALESLPSNRMSKTSNYEGVNGKKHHFSTNKGGKAGDELEANVPNNEETIHTAPKNGYDMNANAHTSKLQKNKVSDSNTGPEQSTIPLHSVDYNHYMEVSFVLAMERQMLEHELLKLSSEELRARMLQTSSAHQAFWTAQYGNGKTSLDGLPDGGPVTGLGHVSSATISPSDTNSMT